MVLEFVFRSTLIAASAGVVIFAFRIRSAAARHALWTGVMLAMLGLPFCPKAPLPVLRSPSASAFVQPAAELPAFRAPSVSAPAPAPARPTWNWNVAAIALYLLGASTLLIRLGVGTFRATHLISASCAAPVTVGLLCPRIVLPDAAASWTPDQLEAVLIHERAHVSRHDPLVQWLALLNRAVFWFHPLAWWLERRLTALAEEACDDAVLRRGLNAADYSAYLLDLARAVQQAGARLNPVALSMPGSDLPRRIRRIAAGVPLSRTSTVRMTAAAAVVAICTGTFAAVTLDPAAQDLLPKPPAVHPKFEVVSIRPCKASDITQGAGKQGGRGGGGRVRTSPGSLVAECQTVENLVRWAYLGYPDGKPWPADKASGLPTRPLPNSVFRQEFKGPGWINSDRYTIEAKGPGEPAMEMMRGPMMQTLLEERFQLKTHIENREIAVYFLTVAQGGPKLQPTKEGTCISFEEFDRKYGQEPPKPGQPLPRVCGPFRPSILDRNPNTDQAVAERSIGLDTWGQTMRMLSNQFSVSTDREVIDRTGLTGTYDIHLELASEDLFPPRAQIGDNAEPPLSPEQKLARIAAAVQKLGLKLEAGKAPMPFLVIDRVERPTEN
jgi:bla regulator protein blaR1